MLFSAKKSVSLCRRYTCSACNIEYPLFAYCKQEHKLPGFKSKLPATREQPHLSVGVDPLFVWFGGSGRPLFLTNIGESTLFI